MAAITIQGVNYKKVATTVLNPAFDIIPFDFGGKALTEMTIVVDSTLAIATVALPEIISSAIRYYFYGNFIHFSRNNR